MTTLHPLREKFLLSLEALLKKIKSTEVDAFWNKAVDEHKAPIKPDMLTYDQAQQLGLTPKDES